MKVLIADDHPVFLSGLCELINSDEQMEVCGEARNGQEAINLATKLSPDIVVMDINMPGIDGIEATKEILKIDENIKILTLSINSDREFVKEMLDAGAVGYLLKNDAPEELIKAIKLVNNGDMFLSPGVTRVALNKDDHELSRSTGDSEDEECSYSIRERQILQLIADGLRNKEIAEKFYISPLTVKKQIYTLYKKLNVSSRIQAVQKAKGKNII
ncbi:MAG: response regulator transcription factor [Deltaproteobacteria bacterium]|nr:response regulator transcription factor [Deltaproteobacteria bacterium]